MSVMREPVKVVEKPDEPIFGSQAGSFFGQLVTLAFALCLVLAVLLLGVFTKDQTQRFLYGDPSHSRPALEPGQSTIIDGVTIKRIN